MVRFHQQHPWYFMVISIAIALIICLNIGICSSQDEDQWYLGADCNLTSNPTNDSTYVSNVNTALNNLHLDFEDTSQSRFDISVYGQSPEQIYALLQCMGYATANQCSNCSEQAKNVVLQKCGTYCGSRTYMKFCFLRFENFNFTRQLNPAEYYTRSEYNVSSDAEDFVLAAHNLLINLSIPITSGSARNRYASDSTRDSSFRWIYGLAQCWGDISLADCSTCLFSRIDTLFKDNAGRLGAKAISANCIVQYESKPFFNSSAPPPKKSSNAAPPQPPEKSSSKIPIILGVLGGLLVLLMACLFATRKLMKNAIFGRPNEGHQMGEDQQTNPLKLSTTFTVFEMETLVAATENFDDKNKLGEGGFGAVYKGTTADGKEIAVKKLSLKSMQGRKEFLNEVELVAKIQHRNLVKLLGCCAEGSERLLVYEYLANNSLDKILFDPNKHRQLDWQKRYNIIQGVTRGLLYLHEDSYLRIIHRDIKASNILLDKRLNPKISDFGLARLFLEDESQIRTRAAGTRGYMAPEYGMHGKLSVKADVYSFGILLLELMSGRKNIDSALSSEVQILLNWAWKLYARRNTVDLIDPTITETCNDQEQSLRCIQVGLLCTQPNPSLRPSMSTVHLMLSTPFMVLPVPTSDSGNISDGPPSITDASITVVVPR